MRNVVQNEGLKEGMRATLDELAREGARRMIEAALEVEVEDYLARFRAERDGDGRALVVRSRDLHDGGEHRARLDRTRRPL